MKVKLAKFREHKVKKIKLKDETATPLWMILLKGSMIALSISLVGVLIFAFFIKFVPVPVDAIRPINQVIKGISLLIGVFIALKKVNQMGLINGLLIGLSYTILAFLVFSILDGRFEFGKSLVNDLLFGGIIGAICGIIAVNFRKKANE
jgi:putative membrane protein (TIGR04086 family)